MQKFLFWMGKKKPLDDQCTLHVMLVIVRIVYFQRTDKILFSSYFIFLFHDLT